MVTLDDGNAVPEVAIAVTPDRRGQGVGAALLAALIDRCTGVHPALALNVHRRNPAQRLYQRKGFRLAGQGRGDLGMAMVADLAAPPLTVGDSSMAQWGQIQVDNASRSTLQNQRHLSLQFTRYATRTWVLWGRLVSVQTRLAG